MPIVSITVANRNFKLSCSKENIEHIQNLAIRIDSDLEKLKKQNSDANFELLLLIYTMGLVDEKESAKIETGGQILEQATEEHEENLSKIFSNLLELEKKMI